MLPDLWRMAHRHVRPAPGALESPNTPRVVEVLAGVAHHGRADTAFHSCEVFREGERAMARELAQVSAPRLPLFAHIAWELCLDGALVRREGRALRAAVHDGLALALERADGEAAVDAAARIHHHARKGESVPEGFDARVGHLLRELDRGPWIEGYARGAVVAERLDGIRKRLGFPPLGPEESVSLGALLEEAIERAATAIDPLLALKI